MYTHVLERGEEEGVDLLTVGNQEVAVVEMEDADPDRLLGEDPDRDQERDATGEQG